MMLLSRESTKNTKKSTRRRKRREKWLLLVHRVVAKQTPKTVIAVIQILKNLLQKGNNNKSLISNPHYLMLFACHDTRAPPWSNWWHVGSQITTTRVWISLWTYLKGVSSLTSLHYLWRSLNPFSLSYAQKWP